MSIPMHAFFFFLFFHTHAKYLSVGPIRMDHIHGTLSNFERDPLDDPSAPHKHKTLLDRWINFFKWWNLLAVEKGFIFFVQIRIIGWGSFFFYTSGLQLEGEIPPDPFRIGGPSGPYSNVCIPEKPTLNSDHKKSVVTQWESRGNLLFLLLKPVSHDIWPDKTKLETHVHPGKFWVCQIYDVRSKTTPYTNEPICKVVRRNKQVSNLLLITQEFQFRSKSMHLWLGYLRICFAPKFCIHNSSIEYWKW